MRGLAALREQNDRPATPVTQLPNERVRMVLRETCDAIRETVGASQWTETTANAFSFGYVRGVLDQMKRDSNPATAEFARALLVQVHTLGYVAVTNLLRQITGRE